MSDPTGSALAANASGWQAIETAPRDGSWFMICRAGEGGESCEVGRYDPMNMSEYVETGPGTALYEKVDRPILDWRGFNNFHRATHWKPLAEFPK